MRRVANYLNFPDLLVGYLYIIGDKRFFEGIVRFVKKTGLLTNAAETLG